MAMELVRSRSRKVAPEPKGAPKKAVQRVTPGVAIEGRRKIGDRYMFKVTCMLKPVHTAAVSWVCWSHDNQKAVTTSVDGSVAIWDMRGDNKVLHKQLKKREPLCHVHKAHDKAVLQAVWSPNDKHIATCGSDTTVRLWEASGRKLCVLTGHLSSVLCQGGWEARFTFWRPTSNLLYKQDSMFGGPIHPVLGHQNGVRAKS